MQRDLIDLDHEFQIRDANFHQNPLLKPIPIDTTITQKMTGYLRRNTTHYWHRILKYFRGYRQFTNEA